MEVRGHDKVQGLFLGWKKKIHSVSKGCQDSDLFLLMTENVSPLQGDAGASGEEPPARLGKGRD